MQGVVYIQDAPRRLPEAPSKHPGERETQKEGQGVKALALLLSTCFYSVVAALSSWLGAASGSELDEAAADCWTSCWLCTACSGLMSTEMPPGSMSSALEPDWVTLTWLLKLPVLAT